MHTEHLKINQQAGAKSGGFPLVEIAKRYQAGEGYRFRRGTPALFVRELLFMIPINMRHSAEKASEQVFEKAGLTSPTMQSFAKWPGIISIFFISGMVTNIPDSLNRT